MEAQQQQQQKQQQQQRRQQQQPADVKSVAVWTKPWHSSVSAVVVPSLIEGIPGLMASVATLAGAARACTRIIALVVAKT